MSHAKAQRRKELRLQRLAMPIIPLNHHWQLHPDKSLS